MSLFVDEGSQLDSVASAMSLRSISWKVGQIAGPVTVGATIDFLDPTAGFLLAAAFIGIATAIFSVTARRAHATRPIDAPNPEMADD